ncbi:hypothetical protein Hanom_Chr09g00861021 [Helianthus anomalus]
MMFLNIKNIATTDLSFVKKHARARSNLTLNTLTRFNCQQPSISRAYPSPNHKSVSNWWLNGSLTGRLELEFSLKFLQLLLTV